MTTSDLVDRLVADLRPVRPGAVTRRLALGLGGGAAAALLAMWLWLGPRPDLAAAIWTAPFWMKLVYTLGLVAAAFWAVDRLARPGGTAGGAAAAGGLVAVTLFCIAATQLFVAAPPLRPALIMGATSAVCPWRILALAAPILAGAAWAVRGLAPTRLALAGGAAGLLAGALAAAIYAIACDENAAPFVAVWYSAGIMGAGMIGAAGGRWALRW